MINLLNLNLADKQHDLYVKSCFPWLKYHLHILKNKHLWDSLELKKYNELSAIEFLNPFAIRASPSLTNHALGACFSPYSYLFNLQTYYFLAWLTKLSGCTIYIDSSKYSFIGMHYLHLILPDIPSRCSNYKVK